MSSIYGIELSEDEEMLAEDMGLEEFIEREETGEPESDFAFDRKEDNND